MDEVREIRMWIGEDEGNEDARFSVICSSYVCHTHLMELQCDLVLASGAAGDVVQRHLEGRGGAHIKGQHRTLKLGRPVVPALDGKLLLCHGLAVCVLEEFFQLGLLLLVGNGVTFLSYFFGVFTQVDK